MLILPPYQRKGHGGMHTWMRDYSVPYTLKIAIKCVEPKLCIGAISFKTKRKPARS